MGVGPPQFIRSAQHMLDGPSIFASVFAGSVDSDCHRCSRPVVRFRLSPAQCTLDFSACGRNYPRCSLGEWERPLGRQASGLSPGVRLVVRFARCLVVRCLTSGDLGSIGHVASALPLGSEGQTRASGRLGGSPPGCLG